MLHLVHFRGYVVLASARVPISEQNLIYGIVNNKEQWDAQVHAALKRVGKRLNLAERVTSSGRRYVGPSNLQVYRGSDGRNYVLHQEFFMPREAPTYLLISIFV